MCTQRACAPVGRPAQPQNSGRRITHKSGPAAQPRALGAPSPRPVQSRVRRRTAEFLGEALRGAGLRAKEDGDCQGGSAWTGDVCGGKCLAATSALACDEQAVWWPWSACSAWVHQNNNRLRHVQSLGNAPGLNNSSASAHASSNVSEASGSVMAEDTLPESGRK